MFKFTMIVFLVGCAGRSEEISEYYPKEEDPAMFGNQQSASGGWGTSCPMLTQNEKTGNFQVNFPEAAYYTLQFGVDRPQGAGSIPTYAAEALITWKVEGSFYTRRVSIGNGVSISGAGQAISVVITDTTPNIGQTANQPYTVSLQVTKGTRPSENQPATLKGTTAQVVNAAGNLDIAIPDDAGVISAEVSVWNPTAPGSTPKVHVLQTNSTKAETYKIYDPTLESGFISIAPSTQLISVVSDESVDQMFVTVTWGIDG